eukprot:gene28384-35178_t
MAAHATSHQPSENLVAIGALRGHPSIKDLEERLLFSPFPGWRLHHHNRPGRARTSSLRSVVEELVDHYCEFMFVLQRNFTSDEYQELSPPPMLDLVWHEHLLDTRGYLNFCVAHFGAFVHHNANGSLPRDVHRQEIRKARTTFEYSKHLGEDRLLHLIRVELWWPSAFFHPLPEEHADPSQEKSGLQKVQDFVDLTEVDRRAYVNRKRSRAGEVEDEARPSKRGGVEQERNVARTTPAASEEFDVVVKSITGQVFTVKHMSPRRVIDDVACEVNDQSGIPLDQMRLICGGKEIYSKLPIYKLVSAASLGISSDAPDDMVRMIVGYKENPDRPSTATLRELGIDAENNVAHL